MPSKEDRGKKPVVDPDTGEVRMHGHHHRHRSRRGQRDKAKQKNSFFKDRVKKAREILDPSKKKTPASQYEDVPLRKRNRLSRREERRRPPNPTE